MQYIISYLLLAFIVGSTAAEDTVDLVQIDDDFWLAENETSFCIAADTLITLNNLIAERTSECMETPSTRPIVVRFVDADSTERFPDGTEGYAGMASYATWQCDEVATGDDTQRMSCQLASADPADPPDEAVALILVTEQDTVGAMFGYLVHELTHAYGTVDGEFAPAHPDYDASTLLEADYCDAYWWYGVVAEDVFTYRPVGLIQDAVTGNCSDSADPTLCRDMQGLLKQLNHGTCP